MPIGDSMSGQPIPVVGEAGTGYASKIVAFLTEVKNRLEAKVPTGSILMSALDFVNNPVQNAKYVGLYEQTGAPTTPVGSLQRYQDNLYYVGPSGAVRITSGTQLDAAGIGGIGGDYAAPAGFNYDLAALEYFAYSDTTTNPKKWARIGAQEFDVYGQLQSTVRVRIDWAGSNNYTLTLPAAVPALQRTLWMDASGSLEAGRSAVLVRRIPPAASTQKTGSPSRHSGGGVTMTSAPSIVWYPVALNDGDTIVSWTLYARKLSSSSTTLVAQLFKFNSVTGAITGFDTNVGNSDNAPSYIVLSQTLGTPYTSAANESIYLEVSTTGGEVGDLLYGLDISIIPV